jgi:selenide, water dikinase
LDQVLAKLPRVAHPDLLVGFNTSDDAGVFRLTPTCALVQTVDFFTPIVDDPFTFGAIAAANSLSDVYAMGGVPVTALSIVCFPQSGDTADLEAIVQGGAAKLVEAGCVLAGGHSVRDDEIKFGYAITGTVHPEQIWTNAGARPGDVLLLSKSIGTGVIATALKKGAVREDSSGVAVLEHSHVEASTTSMLTLNREACEALRGGVVHGCTDVTGFGLLGHAREVAVASGVRLQIDANRVPILPGALDAARAGFLPGGLKSNQEFLEGCVEWSTGVESALLSLLYDPQTSGGLLASVPEAEVARLERSGFIAIGSVVENGALLQIR